MDIRLFVSVAVVKLSGH